MINSNSTQANGNDDQLNIVFNAFFESPKTMQEVSKETGVMRSNICWYIRFFRSQHKIVLVGYRKCKVTGYGKVGIYTTNLDLFPLIGVNNTNPDLLPILNQLELF